MDRKLLRVGVPIEVYGGMTIHSAVADAIELSRRLGCLVTFEFNKTPVMVSPDSDPAAVIAEYHRRFGCLDEGDGDDEGEAVREDVRSPAAFSARIREMGDLRLPDEERERAEGRRAGISNWIEYRRSMLIQFETEDDLKLALRGRPVTLSFLSAPTEGPPP